LTDKQDIDHHSMLHTCCVWWMVYCWVCQWHVVATQCCKKWL